MRVRNVGRGLSRGFVRLMIFAGTFGLALFVLGWLIQLSASNKLTAPIGVVGARYRQFATTGT